MSKKRGKIEERVKGGMSVRVKEQKRAKLRQLLQRFMSGKRTV